MLETRNNKAGTTSGFDCITPWRVWLYHTHFTRCCYIWLCISVNRCTCVWAQGESYWNLSCLRSMPFCASIFISYKSLRRILLQIFSAIKFQTMCLASEVPAKQGAWQARMLWIDDIFFNIAIIVVLGLWWDFSPFYNGNQYHHIQLDRKSFAVSQCRQGRFYLRWRFYQSHLTLAVF